MKEQINIEVDDSEVMILNIKASRLTTAIAIIELIKAYYNIANNSEKSALLHAILDIYEGR